jgi:ubiquinol-cytochrome c reductase cytochrome c1 subunit
MRRLLAVILITMPTLVWSAGGSNVRLDHADYDLQDRASLQKGAQLFMNYCLGCHQMQYQRYQRTFQDLGISDELGQEYLQFTGEKVTDYITSSMPMESAAVWFGAPPPDLTLVSRVRGADWLYTYLRSFYVQEGKTFGVNNKVFPDVGMPHVLEELQGTPREHYETVMVDGEMVQQYAGLKAEGGLLSADEYDKAMLDLVNFLQYSGEPSRLSSEKIGKGVLVFILVFFVFALLLKKEYWREVH